MNEFVPPKKSKHELVSHCWKCHQTTKTNFEVYNEAYVLGVEYSLEISNNFHEYEKAKLREIIETLKKQNDELREKLNETDKQ